MGGMFGGGISWGKWGMNGGGPGGRCRGIMPGLAPRRPTVGGGLMDSWIPRASDGVFSGTILSFSGSSTEFPGPDTK